ncbi:transposase [Xenorhabdus sp. VLS]|uniref:Transposase n=1 Tax=Xenorhabdus lircayensis TaxID=2763499 RepID=A0ABS0UBQ7_9GAMM|nr:transposase [Xenorhabdus lircayensis]
MERIFRSLKSEWIPQEGYEDMLSAIKDITKWMIYYNWRRPHSHNDRMPPAIYGAQIKKAKSVLNFLTTTWYSGRYRMLSRGLCCEHIATA